jgi:hypothetical protein
MTCENCVFSATRKEFGDPKSDRSYVACHCGDNEYYLDGIRGQGNFCHKGQWLWFGKWFDDIYTREIEEKLYLAEYAGLYTKFARDAGQKKVGV